MKKRASQLKVLSAIYSATDCCNGVYDYATLRWNQARIADDMPLLVSVCDNCIPVDGDGFTRETYREGRGYRLTNAGYEALTQEWPGRFPRKSRRFYVKRPTKAAKEPRK